MLLALFRLGLKHAKTACMFSLIQLEMWRRKVSEQCSECTNIVCGLFYLPCKAWSLTPFFYTFIFPRVKIFLPVLYRSQQYVEFVSVSGISVSCSSFGIVKLLIPIAKLTLKVANRNWCQLFLWFQRQLVGVMYVCADSRPATC